MNDASLHRRQFVFKTISERLGAGQYAAMTARGSSSSLHGRESADWSAQVSLLAKLVESNLLIVAQSKIEESEQDRGPVKISLPLKEAALESSPSCGQALGYNTALKQTATKTTLPESLKNLIFHVPFENFFPLPVQVGRLGSNYQRSGSTRKGVGKKSSSGMN